MDSQQLNQQYLSALLSGEADPPIPAAADIIEQMRQAQSEVAQLKEALELGQRQLAAMQERRTQAIGALNHMGTTLIRWRDKQPQEAEATDE